MNKDNLYFDKEQHFWIKNDGEDFYFGITDHAQNELGDILFVELPELEEFEEEDYIMSLESNKKDQELFAPFNLTVTEVNEDLEDSPELINEDAYHNWIFKAKLNEDDLDSMCSWSEYSESIN